LAGKLSVVIPAHNEQDNIGKVIQGIVNAFCDSQWDLEIVLVDDGSSDNTVQVATATAKAAGVHLKLVQHLKKSGYGITVRDGLYSASGDVVGFMDGDGQFDAQDLKTLVSHVGEFDIVTGYRQERADQFFRSVISFTMNVLVRILYRVSAKDVDCGMKVMKKEVLESVSPFIARSALINTELYFKANKLGFRLKQMPVRHYPRIAGKRSGARLIPIMRAVRDLLLLRYRLIKNWSPKVKVKA